MTSKRKRLPKEIKDRLLVDAMHRCCLCPQHEDMTDIHHIEPISEKGPNTEDNLMVVCPNCHAKIHRIRGRYTQEQLRMYKERWVSLCSKGLTLEERMAEAPGINLFIKPILQRGKSGKQGKAYPYLKALLDGLIEAAPNWMKAPAKVVSSLSEQLKDKGKEENKQLEKEIQSISEDELRAIIGEAGWEQREDIKFIAGRVKLIPEILPKLDYRFDKVDEKLEEIKSILLRQQPVASTKEQHAGRDIIQAGRDVIIQQAGDKEKITFPLKPNLNNQTAPEVNFVGRTDMLETITQWYKNPDVRIGGLIGWGGVGKSALVREWYDKLGANNIQPDGIFWWGFYRNASLELFLNALLRFVSGGQIEPDTIKSTWEKVERIKENISRGAYLIILDGLETMQKAEAGDELGKMIHRELTELLHYLADVPKAGGMCLITTRFPIKDLDEWENRGYKNRSLIELSTDDALLMLKKRGVKGSGEEMTEVINRYKGHALSLTSLAGYLSRYYGGDIKEAPDIKFVLSDKERFEDVNKLLKKYAEKMSEAERVFLNIFSLFRQEITERDFAGVFRHKIKGTKFNDVLVEMNDLDFRDLINGLVDWRLISYDETEKTYATHPLIKTYFESDFSEKDKKLCHKRIYEYIGGYAPKEADTLEQMQPLFEQVYHGCAAGLYDEVFDDVCWEKINRREEFFITDILGAWETDISLVRSFFPEGDLSQMPLVSKKGAQSWLLNEAGLALIATGRPKEAEGPLRASIKAYIEDNEIAFASVSYRNLADLQFRSGEIESGVESAKNALEMAEKSKHDRYIVISKGFLGWTLYLSGKTEEAEKEFSQADELSLKIERSRLLSNIGVFYADFLISTERIDDAFELTKQNLEFCQRKNVTHHTSSCGRCLGAINRIKTNYKEAENHLQDAIVKARKVGMPYLEIEALIESGRLGLDMGRYEDAVRDANQVLKLCARTGFRFYEPGAEMILAKAYLALENFEQAPSTSSGQAERFANSAYEKAVGMKYRWAEGDAADLLGEIYSVMGDKANGRKWLKKAVVCRKEILDPKVKETEEKLNPNI